MLSNCVVDGTKIRPISVQVIVNYIYYVELHVSTYLRSSSGPPLVFKAYWGRNEHYVKSTENTMKFVNVIKNC